MDRASKEDREPARESTLSELQGLRKLQSVIDLNAQIPHGAFQLCMAEQELAGAQISDLVRLLTISDIFAALVESRPYRAPMARQDAYQILCGMEGKLEGALIKAFAKVALGS